MVAEFDRRRRYIVERINAIPGVSCRMPAGAFYVMMNIGGVLGRRAGGRVIDGSMAFADALLAAQNVTVVPGIAFMADHHVRMSYATSMESIRKGLDRIGDFVSTLK